EVGVERTLVVAAVAQELARLLPGGREAGVVPAAGRSGTEVPAPRRLQIAEDERCLGERRLGPVVRAAFETGLAVPLDLGRDRLRVALVAEQEGNGRSVDARIDRVIQGTARDRRPVAALVRIPRRFELALTLGKRPRLARQDPVRAREDPEG